jgi:hypothetical protein
MENLNYLNYDSSPIVTILNPSNGIEVYDGIIEVSIEYTDDTGITVIGMYYGNLYSSGVDRMGFSPGKKHYLYTGQINISSGNNYLIAFAYDKSGNFGYDISIFYYNTSENAEPSGELPLVEIIKPENNSEVFTREIDISIKSSDDNGIISFGYFLGCVFLANGETGTINNKLIYFYNKTDTVFLGYNFLFAYAYDNDGNIGYDFNVFFITRP